MKRLIIVLGVIILSSFVCLSYDQLMYDEGRPSSCDGPTDCPQGHSYSKNWKGQLTSCCQKDTPGITGHYHS